jgi:hypothetical protein
VTGTKTGYFHTQQIDGRWWLVTPDGHAFFSKGVDNVSVDPEAKSSPPAPGDREAWATAASRQLREWNFNTAGAWSAPQLYSTGIVYTPILGTTRGAQVDYFSEEFRAAAERSAATKCTPHATDPWLLGYFTDNELKWGNLLETYLKLPESSPGHRKAVEYANNPTEFAALVAEEYTRVASEAIRRHDPNHLILGCRFAGYPGDGVVRAAGQHYDVISFHSYRPTPPVDRLGDVARLSGKPVMVTEFSFKAMDSGLPNTKGAAKPVPTQQDRADGFAGYVRMLAALPYCVGFHWFEYRDEPAEGRFDGENSNYGVVHIDLKPWEVLTARMKTVNLQIEALHASTDVVIYGATSAGLAAAIQVARMGKSVVILDPGTHVGGLTTGGLSWTDIGNKQVVGGIAREFYRRIKAKYDEPGAWKQETRDHYLQARHSENRSGEDAMWTFEPKVAMQVYREMLEPYKIPLIMNARLDLTPGKGVVKQNGRIAAIVMENGTRWSGKMFIDATYEGDLMAKAGVRYTIGREANATYGENYNGVEAEHRHSHQFPDGLHISPFITPGDPASGLLPGIDPKGPGVHGEGDKRIQTYCFRLCMTNAPENRLPVEKPEGYNERDHELLLRYAESGRYHPPASKWDPIPNAKTDTNNHGAVSTDYIGMNYDYPEGDYATRERIVKQHELYTRGYLWTLQNNPRVPAAIRDYYRQWGFPKDEFTENNHWPTQLYIREARRMVSDVVMTEHFVTGHEVARDSVGMGAYGMDSHNVQRYITPEGYVRNEGNIQVGGFTPYRISYRSIVPRKGEAANLFVPVCLSATHIAYGSIRMEPVFMILGESAATAAVMAIDSGAAVQDVSYDALRKHLLDQHQILEAPPEARRVAGTIDPKTLEGIVIDDVQATKTGDWLESRVNTPYLGLGYVHDNNARDGKASLTFHVAVPAPGFYQVRVLYPVNTNRASNALVHIACEGDPLDTRINQRRESAWLKPCRVAKSVTVTISNQGADGYVVVDGVQLKVYSGKEK